MQYAIELTSPDHVQQFLGTVASSDGVFLGRPMDNPNTEELLKYILISEVKATCAIGEYSGKYIFIT